MQLTINCNPYTGLYVWSIYDGPDGVDEGHGTARTLSEAYEQVIIWRNNNAKQYL
ncbi:hypothetical protein SCRM01_183 [Synechococcus phage S-CRM01]|uniref:hypothetical protein n=1 Tax=Synechococcus phage S-CRM01 TaxID=1026955 RepID=UPI000209E408|nr:hypothetical protein SCRM01_183 [Synechococcus phage S-CRM01]AEC53129.1 hypothetical protein SCRM01_183 [Synechococcus phage S-CRM01]